MLFCRLSSQSITRSISSQWIHTVKPKFAGLDEESFCLLATHFTPFMRDILKPKVSKLEVGSLTLSLPFQAHLVGKTTEPACLHGGVIAAMFDHVAGFCAWSALDNSYQTVSTVDLRVDYLLPAPCEEIFFDSVVVSKSKSLVRIDAECWDNKREKKIAIARGLFNIYDSKTDINLLIQEFKK